MYVTLKEFKLKVRNRYLFDKYFNYCVCFFMVILGLLLLFKFGQETINYNRTSWGVMVMGCAALLIMGVYGLISLSRKYKVIIVENKLTKQENVELLHQVSKVLNEKYKEKEENFIALYYSQAWWKTPYYIMMFADEGQIMFNIEPFKGVWDFGALKAKQKMLLKLLTQNSTQRATTS